MAALRVALFVEGSESPPTPRQLDPLIRIWNEDLVEALKIEPFDLIVPISKKHLIAMDPDKPKMSGASEGLDQRMMRQMTKTPFDAAVVAWDLVPAWNPSGSFCRWRETLDLYNLLSHSKVLPDLWRECAKLRLKDLSQRSNPGAKTNTTRLEKGTILAVCMEPMFENLLVQDEQGVKRALGVVNRQIPGWPTKGWGDPQERHPDSAILKPALKAIRRLRPKPAVLKQVRGDFITNKTGWGEYLLRKFLQDPNIEPKVVGHQICVRLSEIL
ncbi:MAG: hypothetical protein QNJ97_03375 [Myxococcota bacterium]|nr:hypothetical protein [Myxococcota bacterium]